MPILAPALSFLHPPHGGRIALLEQGDENGLGGHFLFLSGYGSSMHGAKASALAGRLAPAARFVRFDYQACGLSPGDFSAARLGGWIKDAREVLARNAEPMILIGSSMGAWIALHLARAAPERVKGLFLLAPAADFTWRLLWQNLPVKLAGDLARDKIITLPGEDTGGEKMSLGFLQESRRHLLLAKPIRIKCPVYILHGLGDEVVPVSHCLALLARLRAPSVHCELINSDHRLCDPPALTLMLNRLNAFAASVQQ